MSSELCDECGGFALHDEDCSQVDKRDGERGRAVWFPGVPEDVEEGGPE